MKGKIRGQFLPTISLLITLLVVSAITGCSSGSDNGGGSTVTLAGTVIDAVTESPVNAANVTIDSKTTTTAEDGTYIFTDLSTGTFTLTVSSSGYESYQASVNLVDGANTKNVMLTSTSTQKGKLTGTITSDGSPLEGVTVNLSDVGSTVTGTDGNYSFNAVTYGTYSLSASKSGYTDVNTLVTIDSAEKSYSFAMIPSGNLPDPEEGKGHICGRVINDTGAPLANVKCTLYSLSGKKTGKFIIVYTDGNGQYVFLNVTPGSYQLAFILAGYTISSINTVVTAGEIDEPSNPPVIPNDPGGGGSFPPTILQGTVTGPTLLSSGKSPGKADIVLPGVVVTCNNNTCTTDAQGKYKFENVITPGSRTITATKNNYGNYSGMVDVVQYKTTIKDISMVKGWTVVGDVISYNIIDSVSLYANNEIPYIAYSNNSNEVYAKKYENNAWRDVANANLFGEAGDQSICVDNGTPYITFVNQFKNGLSVYKYLDGFWWSLGDNISGNSVADPCITVSGGVIYVAFRDANQSEKLSVMKYDGSWNYFGGGAGISDGAASHPHIYNDGGIIYVSYIDEAFSNKVTILRYNGIWLYVGGGPGISQANAGIASIFVDSGKTYLGCNKSSDLGRGIVMKYDGGWNQLGDALSIDYAKPWVFYYNGAVNAAYSDQGNMGKVSVRKYDNGTWSYIGGHDLGDGNSDSSVLFIENGTYYVAYKYSSGGNDNIRVKKYSP